VSKTSNTIVKSIHFLDSLKEHYKSLEIPYYKFREWYSEDAKVFFDCEGYNKQDCVNTVIDKDDYPFFKVFFVVKEKEAGRYEVMDVVYPNAFKSKISEWVDRYETMLKPASFIALEGSGKEYVEYLGVSYEE
jgi:hypothetical protein